MDKKSNKEKKTLQNTFKFIFSRFQFTREEIQAFREEHEQRNGDLTKPDDDASNSTARPSSLKRPLDFRWSVNLKEPLPSNLSDETSNNSTPSNILRQTKDLQNSDPFTYRLDINNESIQIIFDFDF
jgi:hypothetical protein